jgi:hypothetical protein
MGCPYKAALAVADVGRRGRNTLATDAQRTAAPPIATDLLANA